MVPISAVAGNCWVKFNLVHTFLHNRPAISIPT
nr:MAG TPA: hypothetical protein [Caudoviricetes sp.]